MNISMVLDRSGSMADCVPETISAVNKYLLEARGDAKMVDAGFDLLIFDSQSIDVIRTGKVQDAQDISTDDYMPRGGTPLYDAIGRGIEGLEGKGSTDNVLVIVTDGEENASRKHTHGSISELIKMKQDVGWLVIFLGNGLNVAAQGARLGVNAGTVASFGKSAAAMRSASADTYAMTQSYSAAPDKMSFVETAAFAPEARAAMDPGQPVAPAGPALGKMWKGGVKPAPAPADAFDKSDAWG